MTCAVMTWPNVPCANVKVQDMMKVPIGWLGICSPMLIPRQHSGAVITEDLM